MARRTCGECLPHDAASGTMDDMSFEVSADAYGRFMGRFSGPLAEQFVDLVGVKPEQRVLDVGCGSGALTAVLVSRVGVDLVSAVDPSASFVEVVRAAYPSMDVQRSGAESLPFPDGSFDVALAQLVVHFMTDPVTGIAEMARTTAPGGVVAASVWDHAGDKGPLFAFWSAARSLDPSTPDESDLPGVAEGHLAELFLRAGLTDVTSSSLTVTVVHPSFEDWWDPFTLGVGPAGSYVAGLDNAQRDALRDRCRKVLPTAPFRTNATAWTALAHV
jgi:SAM-dependent methyltransferase